VARMSLLLLAGFPESVSGSTINRLCGSGLEAVANAARTVMVGEADAYDISRELQDRFALRSHQKAIAAIGVAGVAPRVMGIGPVPATNKALERAGISLGEVGLVELNEAFAAQSLAVLYEWGMDPDEERLNPNGGASARARGWAPVGGIGDEATYDAGARDEATSGREARSLATMCIAGWGIAMVVEA
jgi:acetyl-CoA acetyltransferase